MIRQEFLLMFTNREISKSTPRSSPRASIQFPRQDGVSLSVLSVLFIASPIVSSHSCVEERARVCVCLLGVGLEAEGGWSRSRGGGGLIPDILLLLLITPGRLLLDMSG